MRIIYSCVILVVLLGTVRSYSKFGRKCEDIGCATNEECVMESKPCSYFDRENECGQYPTCKKISNSARTCQTYVCPPSKVCKMDGGIPKCFDDSSKVGSVPLYDTSNINNRYDGHNNPSAPNTGGYNPNAPSAPRNEGSLYPNLGGSGSNYGQNGYRPQGGYPNTGYQQPGGYNGYQQPGYGGYNPNSRPTGYGQQNTYGSNGYNQGQNRPQQGGNQGYGAYGNAGYGNNGYGQNAYGQNRRGQGNSAGTTITDSIKDALKKIGSDFLQKAVSGALKKN